MKRDGETRESKPMDIGTSNPETSCRTLGPSITRCHFPLGQLGLGKFTPCKYDAIAILDAFVFEKKKDGW
jgi:hypothetical protein